MICVNKTVPDTFSCSRVYRRVLAILEVSRGIPVDDVATALSVTRQSVYNWLRRYDSNDCEASLKNRPQSGRPRLLPEHRQSWLKDLMRIRPEARGYFANEWTVPLLQEELLHCTGRYLSADTIGRSLARLGFVWKRPRYVLSPDPDRLKKRRIFREIGQLPPRSVLLAEDETDLLMFPPLRSCWALRGEPACVVISGRNARRVIFGALNLRTGHRLLLPREHQRAVDFQAFLSVVHEHYRGWHVVWLLD